ncbi:MAG: VanW family protein [Tissierellaceae bacterium]
MKKILLILLPIIIILGGVGFGAYYVYNTTINIDTFYPGIKIDEYSMEGMTKAKGLEYIKGDREREIADKSMTLTYKDTAYRDLGLKELGYSFDYDRAIEEAYALGREGNLLQRYRDIKDIKENGVTIPLESHYDKEKIGEVVDSISKDLYVESKNAVFNFNNGNISIKPEEAGRKVDGDALSKLIEENIDRLEDISIPIEVIEPKYTREYYSRINGVIGEFSTSFKNSGEGRKKNIALSANSFNGKILHSGETLSYNDTTGPVQREYGYEEAPVIIEGELTPGIGGGVCQTSTTLYNALLLADLTIVERHPHSIPPAYVNKGQDAAIATGYLDLKFRNDFDYPIYISSKVEGDRVYFYIYGDKKNRDYEVRIQPEITESIQHKVHEELDTNLPPGARELVRQGRNGYKVKTYKSIIKGGKVVDKKQITGDYYRERDFIYKIGPKAAPKNYSENGPVPKNPLE